MNLLHYLALCLLANPLAVAAGKPLPDGPYAEIKTERGVVVAELSG